MVESRPEVWHEFVRKANDSGADGIDQPWPGFLVGGPNSGRSDPAMRAKVPAGLPPAKAYIDDQEAYAANEVAINWNAPLVFLLAGALK